MRYFLDDDATRAALARAPEVLTQQMEKALDRAASETADMMRGEAGKHDLFGTLKASIHVETSRLERFISPGVNYAIPVEEGTGPAAGKARYFPNPDSLLQYLRHSPRYRGFSWARKNSAKRGGQELDLWFRSRAMAMSIYMKGTQPAPFVAPTAQKMTGRFFALMDEGAARGVGEA